MIAGFVSDLYPPALPGDDYLLFQEQDFEKVMFDFENVNPVTLKQPGRHVIIYKMLCAHHNLTGEWKWIASVMIQGPL